MSDIVKQNDSAPIKWNEEQMSVIKQQIAPKCSDMELALFAQVCQKTGLDPFTREIYAISRNSKNADGKWEPKMTIQVSIDGLRKRAVNSGKYDGSETFWCAADGIWRDVWLEKSNPAAAKTIVYRSDASHPFVGVARWDSYKQDTSMWSKMGDVLIAKCSEALAIRKAFPSETSGLYATEEIAEESKFSALSKSDIAAPIKKTDTPLDIKEAFKDLLEDRNIDLTFNGNGAIIGQELIKLGYQRIDNGKPKGDASCIPLDKLQEVVNIVVNALEAHSIGLQDDADEPEMKSALGSFADVY